MVKDIIFWVITVALSPIILLGVLALTSLSIAQWAFEEIDRRWLP